MDEDIELLESFKKGDQQAFERLVTKYKNTVFNTIYSIIGNVHDADDIAQEVFIKVYCSVSSFKYKSLFSTWLYRITVNKCIDELRKKKDKVISLENELNQEDYLTLKDVLQSNRESVDEKLIKEELQGIIQKVLNSLPEKHRIILILREIESLSYNEIAQIMNYLIEKKNLLMSI